MFARFLNSFPCTGGSSELPQFLILGLDGAGKTTFLYRLKMGLDWKTIRKDMAEMRKPQESEKQLTDEHAGPTLQKGETEDPGYHYEELSFPRLFSTCGMWDIPGTEPMQRVWACFYHAIKIHGVIFVVNYSEKAVERIEQARKQIHFLMNEDELRMAPFAVILNVQQDEGKEIKESTKAKLPNDPYKEELCYKLDLHNLHHTCRSRLQVFKINVLDLTGENDKAIYEVMEHMKRGLGDSKSYGM